MRELIRLDLQRNDALPEDGLAATLHVGEEDGFLRYWFADGAELSISDWQAYIRAHFPQSAREIPNDRRLIKEIDLAVGRANGSWYDGWHVKRAHIVRPDENLDERGDLDHDDGPAP